MLPIQLQRVHLWLRVKREDGATPAAVSEESVTSDI